MNIPVLGPLKYSAEYGDYESAPLSIPLLDNEKVAFKIAGCEISDEAEIIKAVSHFLRLGAEDRAVLEGYLFQYYQELCSSATKEEFDEFIGCTITDSRDVWQYIEPSLIYINKDRHEAGKKQNADGTPFRPAIYIAISAGCTWDEEHGLQIIYRHGSILSRISDQDGHLTHGGREFDLPGHPDRIN